MKLLSELFSRENVSEEVKYDIMSKAKLLVSPTLYEGFGLPPVEAMACGCPVIVSNTSCIPEVCGDAAMYIDPYSTESIADAIVELIENDDLRNRNNRTWFKQSKRI